METVVRIRREHANGKPIKAIARDLRLSFKEVRGAIRAPEAAFACHRTVQPLPRLGPFQERLDTLTEIEPLRPDRLSIGPARCPQHRGKDMGLATSSISRSITTGTLSPA